MLRGRNPLSPSAPLSGTPLDAASPAPAAGGHEYDYDTSYEADTPSSHYSSKLHAEDHRHLGLGLGLSSGSGGTSPSLPSASTLPSSSSTPNRSRSQPAASTASSFDMDREWGADKGYAHEYEESSVGGATPKVGLGIGLGGMGMGMERAGRRQGSGSGLGMFGKGKKKRLGLPQRAWMVLIILASLILISKYVFPSERSTPLAPPDLHSHHAHVLTPRDYLNASRAEPAPFEFCPVFGPGDAIAARRGQFELLKSRLHLGTGARVQRVLQKAMSGGAVTMSVLGGSVSACMGAGDDPISPACYPSKFFNWWNSVFPHPANELTNGATRKTDSAYYAYCNSHHMPDKSDLVLLEFDAADPNNPEWLSHFELLVRSVLVRPEMPAVIVLGHFSPQVQAQNGFAGPELLHNVVAQFYDVPHVSVKGLLYDSYLRTPEHALSTFYNDPPLHPNANGHDLIADVLISYMMSQICAGWSTLQGHEFSVPALGGNSEGDGSASGGPSLLGGVGLRKGIPGQDPGDGESAGSALKELYDGMRVPNMRLNDLPNDVEKFREIEPFCVSASDLINPLPPSLFYGSGWHTYHPPKNAITEDRHYWYAEQPTARLRIPLRLGAGDVGIYFMQSPPDKPLGVAKCWVDDNFAGGKELHGTADIEESIATLYMIDRGVSRGSHFVECQLQGEAGGSSAPFKILGVFTT